MKKLFIVGLILSLCCIQAQARMTAVTVGGQGVAASGCTNLITNGTFDSETGWSIGNGTTISGGQAVVNGSYAYATQTGISMTEGNSYTITFDVIAVTGQWARIESPVNTALGGYLTSTGTGISRTFTAGAAGTVRFLINDSSGSITIDNVVLCAN